MSSDVITAEDAIDITANGKTIRVEPGDTVLRAALRAGIGLSYECNSGSCGTCKLTPVNGRLENVNPDASGLSARDRQKGRVLACQAVPGEGGASVEGHIADEYAPRDLPRRLTGRLGGKVALSETLLHLTVSTPEPALFRCGQFSMVSIAPGGAERAFSMANVRNDEGHWEFVVRILPDGEVSSRVATLAIGDTIYLDGPYGTAVLDPQSPRDLVCIAAGSGLAPIVSVLRGAAVVNGEKSAWVIYRDRHAAENHLLGDLRSSFARFSYHTSWPEQSPRETFFTDFMNDEVVEDRANYDYYAAGPPELIKSIVSELIGSGVPVRQITFDLFWPAGRI